MNFRISGEPLRAGRRTGPGLHPVERGRPAGCRRQRRFEVDCGDRIAPRLCHRGRHEATPGTCFRVADYQDRWNTKSPRGSGRNMPEARTIRLAGSVRFWFDTWHDLPQLGGGSDQGILNGVTEQAQWEINLGPRPEPSIRWMQCLGVDADYVSNKTHRRCSRTSAYPKK